MKTSISVEKAFIDMRIDRFIRCHFGKIPQGLIEKNLRNGKIKLNKKKIKSSTKVKLGDQIDFGNLDVARWSTAAASTATARRWVYRRPANRRLVEFEVYPVRASTRRHKQFVLVQACTSLYKLVQACTSTVRTRLYLYELVQACTRLGDPYMRYEV